MAPLLLLWLLTSVHALAAPVVLDDNGVMQAPSNLATESSAAQFTRNMAKAASSPADANSGISARRSSGAAEPAAGTGPDSLSAEMEGIDLGEVGNLIRLLEKGSRGATLPKLSVERAEASKALPPVASKPSANAAVSTTAARDAARFDNDLTEAGAEPVRTRTSTAADTGGRAYERYDPNPSRGLIELASAEQRNVIREAIVYVKTMLDHPATWLVLMLVIVVGVASSFRRGGTR